MARTLDFHLDQRLVGHLIQNDGGQMLFRYAPAWLTDPAAFPISCSPPRRPRLAGEKGIRLNLASSMGLAAAVTTAPEIDGIEYLLSERFDRQADEGGAVRHRRSADRSRLRFAPQRDCRPPSLTWGRSQRPFNPLAISPGSGLP